MPLSFIRLFRTALLSQLAASLLLLSSCTKNAQEQPTPASPTSQANASELQQVFSEKHYDQQVNPAPAAGTSTYKWVPQWHATIWKTGAHPYAYVPLKAQVIKDAQPATVQGVMKYIRFQQVGGKWSGDMFSCFYKLPKGDISNRPTLPLTPSLLSSFTGNVFTKNMETGEELHSAFQNGLWQKPISGNNQGKTNSCKLYYDCIWYVYCETAGTQDGGGVAYYTSGESCEEPTGFTLPCGYSTRYRLQQQTYSHTVCDDPTDPSNPDDPTNPNAPGATTLVDGVYVLMNEAGASASRALAITNNSTAAQALAIINTQPGNPSVSWRLTNVGGGYYTLTSINSGLMLDVQWGGTADGTPIWQYAANGGNAQQWQIDFVGMNQGDSMYKVTSRQSGLVLDLNGPAPSDGTPVVQKSYTGASSQRWSIFYIGR